MNEKPDHEVRSVSAGWEVVDDVPTADDLLQLHAQNTLQRTLQRLAQPFRRTPDPNDPRVQARAAAIEIMDEADAMLSDLYSRYRSRLNMADAADPRESFSPPTLATTVRIKLLDDVAEPDKTRSMEGTDISGGNETGISFDQPHNKEHGHD